MPVANEKGHYKLNIYELKPNNYNPVIKFYRIKDSKVEHFGYDLDEHPEWQTSTLFTKREILDPERFTLVSIAKRTLKPCPDCSGTLNNPGKGAQLQCTKCTLNPLYLTYITNRLTN